MSHSRPDVPVIGGGVIVTSIAYHLTRRKVCVTLLEQGDLASAKYIASKFAPDLTEGNGEGISIEQTENGNLLLGSTREFVGYDKRTTVDGIIKIIRQTPKIIPLLRDIRMIRAFAGLRPYTPDGLPILGPVETIQEFIMAAGHEGDGIALSPITGELIAQLIVDNRSDIAFDDFRLKRFFRKKSTRQE